jgi:hypothetical protein
MPSLYVWTFCTCGHAADEHRSAGPCRIRDSYGFPCGCDTFETEIPEPSTMTEPAA